MTVKRLQTTTPLSSIKWLPWPLLIIASLSWLGAVPPGWGLDSSSFAGHYYLSGVPEVGSELLLQPDGRFHYMLAYGAHDETATGDWRLEGESVILNTSGKYTPPRFTLKQSSVKPDQPLTILVQDKTAKGIPGIDVLVDYGGTKPESGYTQYDGWRASRGPSHPNAIGLGIRMYDLQPQWFRVADTPHNNYVFVFEPGDLGKVLFRNTPLRWENRALILTRGGRTLRYVKGTDR